VSYHLSLSAPSPAQKKQLKVIGKLRRMHRTGNTSFRDKEFVKVELTLSA